MVHRKDPEPERCLRQIQRGRSVCSGRRGTQAFPPRTFAGYRKRTRCLWRKVRCGSSLSCSACIVCAVSTSVPDASPAQRTLPRAKKCPPDTFYTSVGTGAALSSPWVGIKIIRTRRCGSDYSSLVHRKGLDKSRFGSVEPSPAALTCAAFSRSSPWVSIKNNPNPQMWFGLFFFGTPEGTRTPNPRNRNPMLYPLSHRCICLTAWIL